MCLAREELNYADHEKVVKKQWRRYMLRKRTRVIGQNYTRMRI